MYISDAMHLLRVGIHVLGICNRVIQIKLPVVSLYFKISLYTEAYFKISSYVNRTVTRTQKLMLTKKSNTQSLYPPRGQSRDLCRH